MAICKNKGLARTSDNKAYLASVLRTFTQIQPYGWTSDTLVTLCEIAKMSFYHKY